MRLLSINSIKTIITRNVNNARGKNPKMYPGEGIKYPGFTYYPRTTDFKDPPYEPTKLFRLRRIKPLKGLPYWEKQILERVGLLYEHRNCISVVKNIPEINQYLWRIKHLIEIKPITFPNGFPKDAKNTLLKENGELHIKCINNEDNIKALEAIKTDPKRMDGDTLRRQSRMKWLSGW